VKQLLGPGSFRRLFIGQGISALGDWMVTVALMALVLRLSGSSTAVGGVLVLRLVPAALAGPLAARAAHRWDRRRTMLLMDLARAGIVSAIPFIRGLWWVYLWAFMLEVASLVFLPARDASIPDLVDQSDLPVANGLILGSSYGTIPLGAGAFASVAALAPHHGGFLGGHPFAIVFWFDALTFLASFWLLQPLRELGRAQPAQAGDAIPESHGLSAAFRIPIVRSVMPATLTVALGIGALFSLGVVFVREVVNASDTTFGVMIALFGVGAALGLAALRVAPDDGLTQVRWGVGAQGLVVAVMSAAASVPGALIGAVFFGGATAFALSAGMGLLQTALDGEERVLAFAAFHVVIRGGLSAAALGAGVAADLLGNVRWPLLGTVEPARLVLICSGLVVLGGASLVRERQEVAGNVGFHHH
jgi:predicted MFS family arabinose efflux permease